MKARLASLASAFILVAALTLVAMLLSGWDSTAQAQETAQNAPSTLPNTTLTTDAATQAGGATWAIEHVDDSKVFGSMTDRSLALDSADHPHIVYGGDHLYYTWHDGSAWHYETVDGAQSSSPALALDASDRPHISYRVGDTIKYTHWTGTAWVTERVDRPSPNDASTSRSR